MRLGGFNFGISKNVFVLSLVSFFNDVASEMIYPIIPIFLTSVLGAPVIIVGLIEGIAESTSSILKVVSGWFSDKFKKRKVFILTGYSLSAVSKIILALAFGWPLVLLARFIDRFGKGIRTSPRDALIASSCDTKVRGKSFGFHRGFDTLGAVIGPIIAVIAIKFLDNLRLIFFISFIPVVIGIILLIFFVKEKKTETLSFTFIPWKDLTYSFKIFLLVSVIFALGNSSTAFLILRAKNLNLSVNSIILVYILFNFTYAIFSTPFGVISDKIGQRKVLLVGFLFFALIYLFFAILKDSFFLWFLFPGYGIYMALTEGVSKAYISKLVLQGTLATAFGIYQTTIGFCNFFASFIAGILWSYIGVEFVFIFGSLMGSLAAFLFVILKS